MTSLGQDRCWAEIERVALRHNAQVARERIGPSTALLAVVKANGYGHGMVEVGDRLRDQADLFGVANLQEALELRAGGILQPILILGPGSARGTGGDLRAGIHPFGFESGGSASLRRESGRD